MNESRRGAQVRSAAARAIRAVRCEGQSLKAALPPALESLVDARDRALCEAICFEALRWGLRYELILARLLTRTLATSAPEVHALLLAGLAQLEALALADYAVLSSTAEAARHLGHPRLVGLINAVLRRYLRERETLHAALRQRQGFIHAHPAWLVRALRQDWETDADAILAQNNQIAPFWLRVNLRHGTREEYLARLVEAGLEAGADIIAPAALRLDRSCAVTALPGWAKGDVSVQDVSAQLTAAALDAQAGERVLDACAAPGGKAAHLLERTPEIGHLLALDSAPQRLSRMAESLQRLGLTAELRAADATTPEAWWDRQPFDRILLDAPCSGSGVIRRQPDIKLHRRAPDIIRLVGLQQRLLDALWPLLRAGGRLVYATCSVLKDENERQIDAFLARTSDARALALPRSFGRRSGAGRQRLPGDGGGDGFFYAALEKAAD